MIIYKNNKLCFVDPVKPLDTYRRLIENKFNML